MKRYIIALLMTVAAGTAFAVEYDFSDGVQGWTTNGAGGGVDNFGATNGILGLDYVTATSTFDPMIISPAVSFSAAENHWLVVVVNITAEPTAGAQTFQIFFANEAGGFSEGRSRRFNVTPNIGWQTIILDMLPTPDHDAWTGTITRFRLDPGGTEAQLAGYRCEFDRIALTSDADLDGIEDDLEYYWFFTVYGLADWRNIANGTSDGDGNGIPDWYEMEQGWDPLHDDGEKVPAGTFGTLLALGILTAALGVGKVRRSAGR